eukprot:scaffold15517_cov69-Phaeocystis_antarctica.AAC.3
MVFLVLAARLPSTRRTGARHQAGSRLAASCRALASRAYRGQSPSRITAPTTPTSTREKPPPAHVIHRRPSGPRSFATKTSSAVPPGWSGAVPPMEAGSSKPKESSVVTKVRPCPDSTPLVPMETSCERPAAMKAAATSSAATGITALSLVTRLQSCQRNGHSTPTMSAVLAALAATTIHMATLEARTSPRPRW